MPGTLLAAMAMPMPEPHTRIPQSKCPCATSDATGRREIGIVHRVDGVRAEVGVREAALVQQLPDFLLQMDAGMIGAERDAHSRQYSASRWSRVRERPASCTMPGSMLDLVAV